MTKIIVLFFALLLICSHANAQQYGWSILATPRPGYQMHAVEFKDSLHGWCDGGGILFKTTDGGHNWDTCGQPYFTNGILDISFSDTLNGWAVGTIFQDEAVIWKTTDGGKNWSEMRHVVGKQYYGTASIGTASKNITAGSTYHIGVRDTGIVAMTDNGGQLWRENTYADSVAGLGMISFVDSLHGWMKGSYYSGMDSGSINPKLNNGIFRTTDGAISWQLIHVPMYYFSFADTLHGFAIGGWNTIGGQDGFYILRTFDGGLTWNSLFTPFATVYNDQILFRAISFIDSLTGWMFGETIYQGGSGLIIVRTTDGGNSWTKEWAGPGSGVGDAMILDKTHGWMVTLDGNVLGYSNVTGIGDRHSEIPSSVMLKQNYPNPFNPQTTIEYAIPHSTFVQIAIYDVLGRYVAGIVNKLQAPGYYKVAFNASNLSSGIYFYSLQTETYRNTKFFVILK